MTVEGNAVSLRPGCRAGQLVHLLIRHNRAGHTHAEQQGLRMLQTTRRESLILSRGPAAWIAAAMIGFAAGPASAQQTAVVPADQAAILEAADEARSMGEAEAPIRIVEISDFECPFCAQFYSETFHAVDSLYIQTGIARYLWISFPNSRHPRAWPAIEAAFCAGAAGRFWEMHHVLFEKQAEWLATADLNALLITYATGIGIDEASFRECLRNDLTAPLQVSDYDAALRSGITSTPFFVVGDSIAIRGAVSAERFQAAVDSLLTARGLPLP